MKLDLSEILERASVVSRKLSHYSIIIFIVVVASVYGLLFMKIGTLNSAQPSQESISKQSNPILAARVDSHVVSQLQSLQDHSVVVKTLFNQARNNPFSQ